MNGVIYARYSSDNQREESIEGQLRECKTFAEKNDIQIADTYIDRALTAKTDNRPNFQKMIKDSEKHAFDVIIVWKLDRFARNRYDSAHYKAMLKKRNVRFLSATEMISPGAEGILLEAVLEGMAEYYSAELAEKVIRGMTENALKCKYNGGTLPVGYTIDSNKFFQIDPVTAPVVLDAFKHYADGATMQEVTDEMNLRGVHTQRGCKISINSVTRMLHNRKYIGEYKYRDIVQPNGIPAIVPEELFERVQERMAQTKKAPAKHKAEDEYLLTTKLYCGKCGCFMVGESGTSQQRKKVHRYYKCVSVKKHKGCDKKTVKKEWIENIVIEQIKRIIFDDDLIEKLADTVLEIQGAENTTLPLLHKQYAEIRKGIDNMLNAIQQGIITSSTKERLEELEQQKSEIAVQITKEEMRRPTLTKEQIIFWFERFRKLNTNKLEHRRRLIDSFINSVYLYDDRMAITFNYKDSSKTITLEEIENSALGSDLTSLAAPYFKGVPLGTPLKYFYTSKRITGLEGERKENSPADCFPRESYAKLELITRRSKRGRRFRNNKGMLCSPKTARFHRAVLLYMHKNQVKIVRNHLAARKLFPELAVYSLQKKHFNLVEITEIKLTTLRVCQFLCVLCIAFVLTIVYNNCITLERSTFMSKTANLYVRIEPELKEQAEKILSALGIPASNAINMFYKQIILQRGMPFDLKLPPETVLNFNQLTEQEVEQELQKGLDDVNNGNVKSARQAFSDIRKDYNL